MKTPPLQLLSNDTLVISPSQLELMKTCPRMWAFKYLHGRERAGAFAARDGGKAMDEALNRRYRQAGAQAVNDTLQELMLADIDAGFANLDLPLDEYRTAARYKDVVRAYNEHYKEEPFEVLGVQVPFAVELGSIGMHTPFWDRVPDGSLKRVEYKPVNIILRGILDMLVRRRDDGLVLVVDTKTANEWNARRRNEYDNHAQMKAYAWCVPQIRKQALERGSTDTALAALPGRVHGCMVNAVVIRKPYASERSASRADAKPRTEFHRCVVTYSEERLEEWRLDTLAWCQQVLHWVATDYFPQNEKHCSHHYGKQCGYFDVCSVPVAQRALVLGSDLFQGVKRMQFNNEKETTV